MTKELERIFNQSTRALEFLNSQEELGEIKDKLEILRITLLCKESSEEEITQALGNAIAATYDICNIFGMLRKEMKDA